MRCPQCGNDNMEPASSCQVCRAALATNPDSPLSPEPGGAADQPLTAMLYQALIGPVHTDYYLQHFARFDAAGKTALTWHWPALFATLGWFAFRRMWAEALAFAGLALAAGLALFGLLPLIYGGSPVLLWSALALYLLALALLPALWANALYYRHCNRRVTLALLQASDIRETCAQLSIHSSRWRRTGLGLAVGGAVWLLNGAIVAWLVSASGVLASSARPPAAVQARQGPVRAASAVAAPATPASAAAAPATTPAASAPRMSASAPAPAVSVPKAAAVAAVSPSKTGKFIVAVGQFAQEKNASRAYDKLEAAGLPVHSSTLQSASGVLLLIRVGPYQSLADARFAARQIQALELPAVVLKR